MKKTHCVLIIIPIAISSYLYGLVTINNRIFPFDYLKSLKESLNIRTTYSEYYYNKVDLFSNMKQGNYDFVFIGDSITDRMEWNELLPDYNIANRGISKDTTEGILQRLDSLYTTSARSAFIMVGINDFENGVTTDKVFRNYQLLIENIINHGMNVHIQSTIFAGLNKNYLNSKIVTLNLRLKVLANNTANVSYIELNEVLSPSGFLHEDFTSDGIHLNARGYKLWKKEIENHLLK
jgi:lysophospholipase L1-like esterase